jgi:hypothetical protein
VTGLASNSSFCFVTGGVVAGFLIVGFSITGLGFAPVLPWSVWVTGVTSGFGSGCG